MSDRNIVRRSLPIAQLNDRRRRDPQLVKSGFNLFIIQDGGDEGDVEAAASGVNY
jgi:hypothetical protein